MKVIEIISKLLLTTLSQNTLLNAIIWIFFSESIMEINELYIIEKPVNFPKIPPYVGTQIYTLVTG